MLLAYPGTVFIAQLGVSAAFLDGVELPDALDGFARDLWIGLLGLDELASRVGPARDLRRPFGQKERNCRVKPTWPGAGQAPSA